MVVSRFRYCLCRRNHRWGVVDDHEAFQGPAQGSEVLHEEGHAGAALAGHTQARVPVQAMRKVAPLRVQDVQQRLSIALHTVQHSDMVLCAATSSGS